MKSKLLLLIVTIFFLFSCKKDEATKTDDVGSGGSTNGNVMFWTKNSTLGAITVNFNGQIKQITQYQSSGNPSGCGVSGFANYNLVAGTYSYKASSASGIQWSGTVTVPINNGCFLQELTYSGTGGGGGGGSTNGNVMFWTKNSTLGSITVNFNGQIQQITQYQSSGNPSGCGVSGFANFNLAAGAYSYTASSDSGVQWSGSVTVPTNNGCFLQELYYSGTGGGGGSTTGSLIVWQQSDNRGGTATITVNGQKGYITSVYPSATQSNPPPCGAAGCATFYNLAPGNYTVYYSDALGNGTGQVAVVAGACSSFGFY